MPKRLYESSALPSPGFLALVGVGFLLIATLTRLALALYTGTAALPVDYWPSVFLRGIGFDLATLAWLVMPLLFFRAVLPSRLQHGRVLAWLRLAAFFCLTFLLLFGAVAEWTFWEEFSSRFNFIAVDYLVYTHEVIGNILESDSGARQSLDTAILIAVRVLEQLGAKMVTSIEYSKAFDAGQTGQRLLYTFLPRLPESPGAFSEAQLRWINGHYPEDFAVACRERG